MASLSKVDEVTSSKGEENKASEQLNKIQEHTSL